jgi:hypothetical protein
VPAPSRLKATAFFQLVHLGLTVLSAGVLILAWFLGGFWAFIGAGTAISLAAYLWLRQPS